MFFFATLFTAWPPFMSFLDKHERWTYVLIRLCAKTSRNTAALGEVGVYTVKPGSMLAKATYSQNEEGLITATLNRKREGPEASNATGCELMSAPFAHEVFGRLGELGADDGLARAHSTKLPDFTESLSSSMDNIDEYPGLR